MKTDGLDYRSLHFNTGPEKALQDQRYSVPIISYVSCFSERYQITNTFLGCEKTSDPIATSSHHPLPFQTPKQFSRPNIFIMGQWVLAVWCSRNSLTFQFTMFFNPNASICSLHLNMQNCTLGQPRLYKQYKGSQKSACLTLKHILLKC